MNYLDIIIPKINKAAIDEYTAVKVYDIMSKRSNNPHFAEEMIQHSGEEQGHLDRILKFCHIHDISVSLQLDESVMKRIPYDDELMFKLHQELENTAILDYTQIVMIARNNNDFETEELFKDLLEDEMTHFDDIALLTGDKRPILFS